MTWLALVSRLLLVAGHHQHVPLHLATCQRVQQGPMKRCSAHNTLGSQASSLVARHGFDSMQQVLVCMWLWSAVRSASSCTLCTVHSLKCCLHLAHLYVWEGSQVVLVVLTACLASLQDLRCVATTFVEKRCCFGHQYRFIIGLKARASPASGSLALEEWCTGNNVLHQENPEGRGGMAPRFSPLSKQ